MSKTAFARATFTFDSVDYGVTDFELGEEYSEIDVTDTESVLLESEFLGGRRTRPLSFTLWKPADVADIAMNTAKVATFVIVDDDAVPNTTTYSGSALLLTKRVGGNIDGAVSAAYTGRFTGAVTEVQT